MSHKGINNTRYRAPIQPAPKQRKKSVGRRKRNDSTSAGIRDMFYKIVKLKEDKK